MGLGFRVSRCFGIWGGGVAGVTCVVKALVSDYGLQDAGVRGFRFRDCKIYHQVTISSLRLL